MLAMGKLLKNVAQIFLATIIFFIVLEIACRLFNLPPGTNRYNETVILKNHLSVQKPSDEIRIFTFGESTMHGSHYYPYSNPAKWLEAYLKDFLPDKKIRVINFARMGQATHNTLRSVHDTMAYHPDIMLFYVGHNQFLPGNRLDEILRKNSKLSTRFKELSQKSRLISAVVRYGISKRMERGKDDSEDVVGASSIETAPSGIGGAENIIYRNSPRYQENMQFFWSNIQKILDLGRQEHAPMIFFSPVSNLKDYPPSCSSHLQKLDASQSKQWEQDFEAGKIAQNQGDWANAKVFFQRAAGLDDSFAELDFRLGQVLMNLGELEKAKSYFVKARDYDCIIVRATSDKIAMFDQIKKSGRAEVIETEPLLVSEAPGGILGYPIIEDNVHFSIKGHALTGRAAAQLIAEKGWIAPKKAWQFDNERSFEDIENDLGVTPDLVFKSYLECVSYFGSKYDSRILYAKKALEIKPKDPLALRHLAWSYWIKGDIPKALETYQQLRIVAPEQLSDILQKNPGIKEALDKIINPAKAA